MQNQPLHTITEAEYYNMSDEEYNGIEGQLDAILVGLERSLKRQDVWSAVNLALLLPRFMVIDDLQAFLQRLETLRAVGYTTR